MTGRNNPEQLASDTQADKGNFDSRIHIPGVWRCAKCQFRLIQSNLNSRDGSVTARDEAGEPCPNCAVPLWRVTWREEAEDLMHTQDETWDRALEAGKRYGAETEARVARFCRHWLGHLEYRQTGRDPKNNGFAFAAVPDWALRQLADPLSDGPLEGHGQPIRDNEKAQ